MRKTQALTFERHGVCGIVGDDYSDPDFGASPPRDKEVVAMPQWPIRVKLIAGLSLVVGMMLTLMGGSIFGLHAFHSSNLTLVDQLRELGASKDLLQVRRPARDPADGDTPEERRALERQGQGRAGGADRLSPRAEEEHDHGATGPTTAATS